MIYPARQRSEYLYILGTTKHCASSEFILDVFPQSTRSEHFIVREESQCKVQSDKYLERGPLLNN